MTTTYAVVRAPFGPVTVAVADGAVTDVRFPHLDGSAATDGLGEPAAPADDPVLAAAVQQLTAYLAGELRGFDLPLRYRGSPFQQRVWEGLRAVPYGTTTTYGALATALGLDPRTSARAVGAANGANRLPIVVPCHRVIGADGTLTGFSGGVERKRELLALEARVASGAGTLF
ncbi:methylated-DNA--[protein]-cysteine S-methyltransferase [Cellulomonas dongxiuzhuiae]|uniref:Methylated-DNA--protein-cysteine methyltransferase n=1 Tax=Cellulomonas dongxiuzhuiae TaxID=2819979 RepID=A0ABX8GGX0_9CELL|nr:methylated-DNA--[protein]-cysteine S-methyltransferase [Cellulomonas dongxiuzhuiae]MBO3088667.1 methylated-DNA--[protein]-cysteine S-methyltransferase [Cellulomonas dongxiuzhuiae]MBO3094001.1 methylated-DNA--[protein]-cysteine S-methyltransferase [Cellulomonas dongxiuzhuiae]QWC15073.1 methylated-DNA--[protein]-cysteine S-methyltransferase [Cellulomonas dongxiuzhuiae]